MEGQKKVLLTIAVLAVLTWAVQQVLTWKKPLGSYDDIVKNCDFELPKAFASDQWVMSHAADEQWIKEMPAYRRDKPPSASEVTPWKDELDDRESEMKRYLAVGSGSDDVKDSRSCANKLGFREGQDPHLAWEYFEEHPLGYSGWPLVIMQTLLSLDPAELQTKLNSRDPNNCSNRNKNENSEEDDVCEGITTKSTDETARELESLLKIAKIWKKKSPIAGENHYTTDHLGFSPNRASYDPAEQKEKLFNQLLPNGLVFDPEVIPRPLGLAASIAQWIAPDWRKRRFDEEVTGWKKSLFEFAFERESTIIDEELERMADDPTNLLKKRKARFFAKSFFIPTDYDRDLNTFQQAPRDDAVFFSCSGCHQGRLKIGQEMKFFNGVPSTEVEPQHFQQSQMLTGLALIESGWSTQTDKTPTKEVILNDVKPDKDAIVALFTRMIDRARDGNTVPTIYGDSEYQTHRAKLQTYWVADNFPEQVSKMMGLGIVLQYIFLQIEEKYAYKDPEPLLFTHRQGQMDAFAVSSGLVALHSLRPDNSYLRSICRNNYENPLFDELGVKPGPSCDETQLAAAAELLREKLSDWAPQVPAPSDIPNLNWMKHRVLANWDGNQAGSARTLASGASATGDPSKVNVRIHEPLNPMLNHLPPPPYPFAEIETAKDCEKKTEPAIDGHRAAEGMRIFFGRHPDYPSVNCAQCHVPDSAEIVPITHAPPPAKDLPLTVQKNEKRLVHPAACKKNENSGLPSDKLDLCTDGNRTVVNTEVSRYGLAQYVLEACNIFVANTGNDWCLPHDKNGRRILDWDAANDDYFKDTPARVAAGTNGYKVDMQHAIWARAPYLHNGSVPTLGHLICPEARPEKFLRGVITDYDTDLVGFNWHTAPTDRVDGTQHINEYDTTLFGQHNRGHEYGRETCWPLAEFEADVNGDPILTADGKPKYVGGGGQLVWLDPNNPDHRTRITTLIKHSPAGALIEYMKTF